MKQRPPSAGSFTPLAQQAHAIDAAADLIAHADALLIAAGAGIGVDSGLPDFRGTEGFWKAYPALGRRGLNFEEVASPRTFVRDPGLAWGFYGHRLDLYRRTVPHTGFRLVRAWGERMLNGAFVFTSNVDGQFQRAGFAHFSDRGHRFRRDRGRRFSMIVDDHGHTRVKGFIVSQSSTTTVKRRALSTPASSAGVVNAAPKAIDRGPILGRQACPRRRASLATNDRRGGQAVFDAAACRRQWLREAVMPCPASCASTRP